MEGIKRVARVPATDVESACSALAKDGAVLLEDVWPVETIDKVRDIIERRHPDFSDRTKLADWVDNGEGRFIAPVTICAELFELDLFGPGKLDDFLCAAIEKRYQIEAFGMMMAGPHCPEQHAHRDGGIMFPEVGVDAILPASALTVAIPLVDVDADCAPTAMYPGTHRFGSADGIVPDIPEYRRGSMFVWDFRVWHHGCENRTDAARPLLYFTACRPFWLDHKNFKKKNNRRLLAESDVIEKLGPQYVRAELA